MALDQSALLEVLHVLKTAKVDDRIRRAAETVYQALIEAELTAMTGAFPHQRTEALTASTNPLHPAIVATARVSSPDLVPGKRAETNDLRAAVTLARPERLEGAQSRSVLLVVMSRPY